MQKEEQETLLQAMLPEHYRYKFLKYNMQQNNLQEIKFCLETRVDVSNQNSVKQFLSELNESTGCTFNIQSGRPDNNKESHRAKCSGFRKCCMKVASSGKKELQPGKNTNCEAKINFRLENPVAQYADQRKDKKGGGLVIL